MKRFYVLYAVVVPITTGLMLMWSVDDVFTADATTPPAATSTISSAVANASSAIATASSAIAIASSAIATASSAIATASSAIATTADPSTAVMDAIACDNDTAKLCNTAAAYTSGTSGTSDGSVHDSDCSTVASAGLRLGHGVDESPIARVDDDRGRTGRIAVVRPRTGGVKAFEQIILTAMSMFFEKLELALYMSLYKLKVLYTTLILPVLHSF